MLQSDMLNGLKNYVNNLKHTGSPLLAHPNFPQYEDAAVEFLSSMCVIEHVGLGRYGDTIDTQGSIKAFKEVSRVIRTGGHFLFSVPLSHTPGLCFNAHRIFSKPQVVSLLPNFTIQEERFFFPEPGNETEVAGLQNVQFCIWCVHMIKN